MPKNNATVLLTLMFKKLWKIQELTKTYNSSKKCKTAMLILEILTD